MIMNQSQQQYWEAPANSLWQQFGRLLQEMGKQIVRYSQLAEQRRQLLNMDSHLLKDIGVNRAEIRKMTEWSYLR